jgi:type IV pilus assembly protein PilM
VLGLFEYKTAPLVGIDISSSSVKLIEIGRTGNVYSLDRYTIEPLPPNAVVERTIKQVAEVAETIKLALKRSGTTRPFASIAVSGTSVITRIIQVNAEYNETEIAEQIELEASRYIPYSLEEVYYDFEVLGPSSKHPQLMDVLLAAARIDTVDSRVEAVRAAGLKVTIVDVESFTVERAFSFIVQQLTPDETRRNIALVDIGSTVTTLHVFQNLKSIYIRDQVFGSKQLSDEIQRRYSLTPEEALAALKYGGLPEDYTQEVLEPFKETVVQQINRALQVFFSSSEETEVQYLALSGGGSQIAGLEETIQSRLGIKTFIANPFVNMQIAPNINRTSLQEDAPSLLVGLGLALRNFDEQD